MCRGLRRILVHQPGPAGSPAHRRGLLILAGPIDLDDLDRWIGLGWSAAAEQTFRTAQPANSSIWCGSAAVAFQVSAAFARSRPTLPEATGGRCQTVHKHLTNIRRSVACCGHRANTTASFESEADELSPGGTGARTTVAVPNGSVTVQLTAFAARPVFRPNVWVMLRHQC
jgi:hypothetical protein